MGEQFSARPILPVHYRRRAIEAPHGLGPPWQPLLPRARPFLFLGTETTATGLDGLIEGRALPGGPWPADCNPGHPAPSEKNLPLIGTLALPRKMKDAPSGSPSRALDN